MAKTIDDLKSGGFLPRRMLDRMAETEPGQLAALVGQMLYDGDVRDVPLPSSTLTAKHFTVPDTVYCSAAKGGDNNRHEVRQALNRIQDYLEACALRESAER